MAQARGRTDNGAMSAFLYLCPNTGQRVQGWSSADRKQPGTLEAVTCLACGRVHLIDPKAPLRESHPTQREDRLTPR
jgi:hypothetical protein